MVKLSTPAPDALPVIKLDVCLVNTGNRNNLGMIILLMIRFLSPLVDTNEVLNERVLNAASKPLLTLVQISASLDARGTRMNDILGLFAGCEVVGVTI